MRITGLGSGEFGSRHADAEDPDPVDVAGRLGQSNSRHREGAKRDRADEGAAVHQSITSSVRGANDADLRWPKTSQVFPLCGERPVSPAAEGRGCMPLFGAMAHSVRRS